MTHLPDILLVAGAAAVCVGLWQAWPPLAWIVGGAVAIAVGLVIQHKQRKGPLQ